MSSALNRYCVTLTMSSTVIRARSSRVAICIQGQFSLAGDVARQRAIQREARRPRREQPALPRRYLDAVAVTANLVRHANILATAHSRPSPMWFRPPDVMQRMIRHRRFFVAPSVEQNYPDIQLETVANVPAAAERPPRLRGRRPPPQYERGRR